MRPSRPTTRSTRTASLASASFRPTIALNSAAMARMTAGFVSSPGLTCPFLPFLPFLPFFSYLRVNPVRPPARPGRRSTGRRNPLPARRAGPPVGGRACLRRDVPLRDVRLGSARDAIARRTLGLFRPRRIHAYSSSYAAVAPPPCPCPFVRLGALDGQPVDVPASEQPASAHRPHRRQAAIVGKDADGVRRQPQDAGRVARGEKVVWMLVFMRIPRSWKGFSVATGRGNHFYEPRQGHPDKNGALPLGGRETPIGRPGGGHRDKGRRRRRWTWGFWTPRSPTQALRTLQKSRINFGDSVVQRPFLPPQSRGPHPPVLSFHSCKRQSTA